MFQIKFPLFNSQWLKKNEITNHTRELMLHVPMSLIYCILPDYLNSDLQDNVRVYPLPHQEWRRTHLYSHLDPTVFKLILVEKKRMFFFKKDISFFPTVTSLKISSTMYLLCDCRCANNTHIIRTCVCHFCLFILVYVRMWECHLPHSEAINLSKIA